MLLLGQREIKQHTLVMNWHNAKIILLCIIVYPLRRFEISLYSFQSIFILVGLSRGLGRRKSCLGRYLFRPSSWGELSIPFFFFLLFTFPPFSFFLVLFTLGGHNPGLSIDHRALLQPAEYTRSL